MTIAHASGTGFEESNDPGSIRSLPPWWGPLFEHGRLRYIRSYRIHPLTPAVSRDVFVAAKVERLSSASIQLKLERCIDLLYAGNDR